MAKFRVYLSVGHGDQPNGLHDPGAVSKDHRWSEQSAGDLIVAEAARMLRASNQFDVVDEAYKDDQNYVGTTRYANAEHDAGRPFDLIAEAHHDWYGGVDGAFVHWHSSSTAGKAAADAVLNAIEQAGFKSRRDWHRSRDGLYLLSRTKNPAILIEFGRIGSPTLDEAAELTKAGAAMARGIAAHFGVSLDVRVPSVSRDAAISAYREPDVTLARALAHAHRFAFVLPHEDRWVQVYPDGKRVFVDEVKYLVGIGWQADVLVSRAGDGVNVTGASRGQTLVRVVDMIRQTEVSRSEPWRE